MSDDATVYGFFKSNIKRALIIECLESGNPDGYFQALWEVMEDMSDEILDNDGDFPWDWSDVE